ncbi:alpha-N-arabinofuranosidase [Acetatifactor muris]|uniref:non-reducing end alpha-L-arabinofuranosidase n=1 Tax=Acetatifactor muris TaxID=879566 RepID=A0A2K4ZG18_9FIRM|nr:alpha-L-arabinofuranosidase C-terminal domain-containing protein [Acetatifactor muris]MCR2047609.1 alpha-N-arabinofuranosidase [Acetatifactor muris]SOY29386.1 Intracellular exo-alpha-L-arabinofuranosidase 2 [Acetatifactor muris]
MAKLYVNPKVKKGHLNPELQGHFSEHLGRCIYEGIYVGENSDIPNVNGMRTDVVEALKEIHVPVLRWPGGCFADEYHWKDGIGPKEGRKKMINTHWGGVVEDNSFGTHEFMELCRQVGCKTYINGNVGSGTVQEMSEWVEYMTFEGVSPMADLRKKNGHEEAWTVDYFGVGNENWGCGGNMRPEYYGDLYRRYQTYIRNYDREKPVYKIACGANAGDYHWTDKVLETTFDHGRGFMNGLSLHYYTVPGDWGKKGSALEFDEKEYYRTLKATLKMEELIKRHGAIMDQYDPEKKIGMVIDEWGTWYDVEPGTNPGFLYQQNTMRDALVAGINLNLFNKNCDRVKMANIAQMVNVLQSVLLTDGKRMVKTPTWYAFHMYQVHQDAELVESFVETREVGQEEENKVPNLTESVSQSQDGKLHLTLTNLSLDEAEDIESIFADSQVKAVKGTVLTGKMQAHNTFDEPDQVHEEAFSAITVKEDRISFTIPACSVLHLEVELA